MFFQEQPFDSNENTKQTDAIGEEGETVPFADGNGAEGSDKKKEDPSLAPIVEKTDV